MGRECDFYCSAAFRHYNVRVMRPQLEGTSKNRYFGRANWRETVEMAVNDAAARGYCIRGLRLVSGLFLFAAGIQLTIQAYIGLAPWDAFTLGVTNHVNLSYGTVSILTGFVLLATSCALGEKLGLGTIINTFLIGLFVDAIALSGLIPRMNGYPAGIAMLLAGLVVISLGSYFYIGSAMGCGPRDALMVALRKRLPSVPVGAIRSAIEGMALLAGWLLGARVGLGTVISVLCIGFILQCTFGILKFDVANVQHESLACTIGRLRSARGAPNES